MEGADEWFNWLSIIFAHVIIATATAIGLVKVESHANGTAECEFAPIFNHHQSSFSI